MEGFSLGSHNISHRRSGRRPPRRLDRQRLALEAQRRFPRRHQAQRWLHPLASGRRRGLGGVAVDLLRYVLRRVLVCCDQVATSVRDAESAQAA